MFGIDDAIAGVSKLVDDVVNTAFPTPEAKASAEAIAIKAQAEAVVASTQVQLSAVLAEASSGDRWTSRARPSFFYVFYVLILMAIPVAVVHCINPALATDLEAGMREWLSAIPSQMWDLFQAGFLGYVGGRSMEKIAPAIASAIRR